MSHMEQAYGFTPTHTEHKIISYSAYQISQIWKKRKKEITEFIMWKTEKTDAVLPKETSPYLNCWDIVIKLYIVYINQAN